MHWQEAVVKSPTKRAYRRSKMDRLFIVDETGYCIVKRLFAPGWEDAKLGQWEGFGDWEPYEEGK